MGHGPGAGSLASLVGRSAATRRPSVPIAGDASEQQSATDGREERRGRRGCAGAVCLAVATVCPRSSGPSGGERAAMAWSQRNGQVPVDRSVPDPETIPMRRLSGQDSPTYDVTDPPYGVSTPPYDVSTPPYDASTPPYDVAFPHVLPSRPPHASELGGFRGLDLLARAEGPPECPDTPPPPPECLVDIPPDLEEHLQSCRCPCDHLGYGNYQPASTRGRGGGDHPGAELASTAAIRGVISGYAIFGYTVITVLIGLQVVGFIFSCVIIRSLASAAATDASKTAQERARSASYAPTATDSIQQYQVVPPAYENPSRHSSMGGGSGLAR
ncbi:hypothetical protein FJT64_013882 [Amphibalanus amphitrite]|uniref:Uncharacterized protein n=1 Tax=Amphibalanus amphitrite TaxID=1232801 RepID=A0A6A4VBI0_AMPAM|nr:hypothetical protein FJT64_013882 [Amphibalanus amphitrite]